MDQLFNQVGGAIGGAQQPQAQAQVPQGGAAPNAGAGQKEDYGDKALDFLSKKAGHPVDRNTGEKITDGARGLFEKATGKHVNPKISN